MGDGGSQSPITLRLNSLASRRAKDPRLAARIQARLDTTETMDMIAATPLDGTTVARRRHEREHIGRWPLHQKEMLRAVILESIAQRRQIVYDWQYEDADQSIEVQDDGTIIGVTFKSRQDA